MQEDLHRLIALQNLDWDIRTLALHKQDLPAGLREAEEAIAITRQAWEETKQQLEGLQTQQRQLDDDMALLNEGITRSRQRLMEIKDNFEYKAMLREIAFKEDRKDQKDTEILRLMDSLEELRTALQAQEETVARLEREFQGRQAEINSELDDISSKLEDMAAQRQGLLQAIPKALLKKYDFIRERRNGIAIAEVRQGVCQVCHMNIPPQQFIELQRDEEILACPHCQRIIYWLGPESNNKPLEADAA